MSAPIKDLHQEITDLIEELRRDDITVAFTRQGVRLDDVSGDQTVTCGMLTETATGHLFVELYDCTERVRLHVLRNLAEYVGWALEHSRKSLPLHVILPESTVCELRAWAALQDRFWAVGA